MGEQKKRSRTSSKRRTDEPETTFEESLSRLEQIVQRLETSDLPLEDALALFEEGIGLARSTQRQLQGAERRVEQLLNVDEDGNPVVKEFAIDEED